MTRVGLSGPLLLLCGCLTAPTPAADGGAGGDGGSGRVVFPPVGHAFHLASATSADIDADGTEDLLLVDDDDSDGASLYLIYGGNGLSPVERIELDLVPTAIWHGPGAGSQGQAAIIVAGSGGSDLIRIERDMGGWTTSAITLVPALASPPHALLGGRMAGESHARLLISTSSSVHVTEPLDASEVGQTVLTDAGVILDATYWPLDGLDYELAAVRDQNRLRWWRDIDQPYQSADLAPAERAHFADLFGDDLCASQLAIAQQTLSWHAIECANDQVVGTVFSDLELDRIVDAVAADVDAPPADIAVLGRIDQMSVVQVIGNLERSAGDGSITASYRAPVAVDMPGLAPDRLLVADVEGDGSALIYALGPTGAIDCLAVAFGQLMPCPDAMSFEPPL